MAETVLKMFPPHQTWLLGCLLLSSGYYSNIGKKERPPSLPPRPPPHHFTAGKSGHRLCHHKSGNCTLQANWLKCSYHVKGGMITKCILQVDIKHGMSKIYIYLDHQIPRHLGRTFLAKNVSRGWCGRSGGVIFFNRVTFKVSETGTEGKALDFGLDKVAYEPISESCANILQHRLLLVGGWICLPINGFGLRSRLEMLHNENVYSMFKRSGRGVRIMLKEWWKLVKAFWQHKIDIKKIF